METLIRILLLIALAASFAVAQTKPLRVGIAGLVHGHAGGFFRNHLSRPDLQIAGVSEADATVVAKYAGQYKLPQNILFASHAEMMDKTRPDAVMIFSNTFDHKAIVELCADRGIPVMMEKPLAVSVEHAQAIAAAQRRSGIPVLVNYETTWYPVNAPIQEALPKIGEIRRIVTHYGHPGPKEIGTGPEFLNWLRDPVKNGAGALFDFGCYGANFATWLLRGERPLSVFAVTHTNKPDIYPHVDDEATVIVQYAKVQLVIQPSWNWPFHRKDMEVYGQTGEIVTSSPRLFRTRLKDEKPGQPEQTAAPLPSPHDDVIHYLTAVVRRHVTPDKWDLSSLENNLLVTEILDAARQSAKSGKAVALKPHR
jgi:predicted dehydrogenase